MGARFLAKVILSPELKAVTLLKLTKLTNTYLKMKLNPPTKLFFSISLVLAILACLVMFTSVTIPVIGSYAVFVLVAAYVVLAASCVLKGV